MPSLPDHTRLSRRERQVMDVLIRKESATAREIERELPDPPTYSAVRSILRIMTRRGLVTKVQQKGRDLYSPVVPAARARIKALHAVVKNFFSNSAVEATCALLGNSRKGLTAQEARRLQALIDEARRP